jgi:hypothetical protein
MEPAQPKTSLTTTQNTHGSRETPVSYFQAATQKVSDLFTEFFSLSTSAPTDSGLRGKMKAEVRA